MNGNSSYDSFSITNSTNTNGPSASGLDNGNENGVNTGMGVLEAIKSVEDDDPHLFSSLINLPTFAKNGEKVKKN